MNCIVLLGFSTTGKSTILRDFQTQYGDRLETLDSDREISAQDGGHIYNIYFRYRRGHDTGPALREIEQRERQFLVNTKPRSRPVLLAAGPYLPIRQPEWTSFLNQACPTCFYLQKSAADVVSGLVDRRTRQLQCGELGSLPGFGCWDEGVTTEFRGGDSWELIGEERALENIRRNMGGPVPIYERLAVRTFEWQERQRPEGKKQLYDAIRAALGLIEP